MIDAEEIAKLPPMRRIKPLALALAYDFIPFAALLALAALIAAAAQPAHAAIHTDKPVQETAPVASKPTICTVYIPVMAFSVIKDGKPHLYVIVIPRTEPCH